MKRRILRFSIRENQRIALPWNWKVLHISKYYLWVEGNTCGRLDDRILIKIIDFKIPPNCDFGFTTEEDNKIIFWYLQKHLE